MSLPFVGQSGRHLNKWLVKAGIPREQCAISNIVWCNLPKNRAPTTKETAHCWAAHVLPHLRSLPSLRVIAAVGKPAAQHFLGRDFKVSGVGAPAPWKHDGVAATVVVPVVHPAAIIRGGWASDPQQPKYLRRAWDIACGEGTTPALVDVNDPPPGGVPLPTLPEVERWLAALRADHAAVACDIEGTGGILIGIGFCRLDTLAAVYVPFRDRAAPYWGDLAETSRAARAVADVLADPTIPKVFHNGSSFDIPFLEEIGFVIEGYDDDTMVRSWATYHEMEKSLQSLGILFAGLPAWKWLSKVDSEGENK